MSQTLLPGSIVAMTDQAADRLLRADSGDAALLYLRLLRTGTVKGLSWSAQRLDDALAQLRAMGLAPGALPVSDPAAGDAPPAGVCSGGHQPGTGERGPPVPRPV